MMVVGGGSLGNKVFIRNQDGNNGKQEIVLGKFQGNAIRWISG